LDAETTDKINKLQKKQKVSLEDAQRLLTILDVNPTKLVGKEAGIKT